MTSFGRDFPAISSKICKKTWKQNSIEMKTVEIAQKPYKCPQCEVRFSLKRSIPRHIKEQHDFQPKLQCVYCNKNFLNDGNHKVHYARAHKMDFLLYLEPRKVSATGETFLSTAHIHSFKVKIIFFFKSVHNKLKIMLKLMVR